jgi:type I restriction enzyme S subunit
MDLPVQDRTNGNYPVVASTGIVGFHTEGPVKGPGVVIGRSGSIGGGQFIDQDFWPLNTTLWVKDFKGNDPRYCYYLLKSIDFKSMNAGSGVPTLNRNHLHPMAAVKAPLKAQKAIAGVLGDLDDRITLLRETNTTLEAIAQALFKSWFVDFDPVHAKMQGRAPEGMDQATAALFPDSF